MTIVGTPVDKQLFQLQPGNGNIEPTPADLADLARTLQNDVDRGEAAKTLLNQYKQEAGDGISTLIMIFNGTGQELSFLGNYDDSGHIGKYPYDTEIANGQWSAVLHVKTSGAAVGSVANVAYQASGGRAFVIGWSVPFIGSSTSRVTDHTAKDFQERKSKLLSSDYISTYVEGGKFRTHAGTYNGYRIEWAIGNSTSPVYTVRLLRP